MTAGIGLDGTSARLRVATAERRPGQPPALGVTTGSAGEIAAAMRRTGVGRGRRLLAAVALARTTHRLFTLPFASPRTLAEVVPLELRGQLPADPADACVGFEIVRRSAIDADVLAFVARVRDLEAAAEPARALGNAARGLLPAPLALRWLLAPGFRGLVLVADGCDSTVTRWDDGRPRALRALAADARDPAALARELTWTLPALGGDDEPFVVAGADASDELVAACRAARPTAVHLAGAHLAIGMDPRAVRTAPVACGLALAALDPHAAIPFPLAGAQGALVTPRLKRLVAAAAALAVVDWGIVRFELARRETRVRAALEQTAARALRDEPIVAPRAQLEAALARDGGESGRAAPGSALERWREVSDRIPPGLIVDLSRLTFDGEDLQLAGTAPTFESVDTLRRALAASARLRDVTTDEVRTTVAGDRVGFRLRARWVAPGAAPS